MKKAKKSILEEILIVIGYIVSVPLIILLLFIKPILLFAVIIGMITGAYNTDYLLALYLLLWVLDFLYKLFYKDDKKKAITNENADNSINEKIKEKELKEQIIEKEKSELAKAIKNIGEEQNNTDNTEEIIDKNKT